MEVTLNRNDVRDAVQRLQRLGKDAHQATVKSMTRITLLVHRDAIRNAPRSPSASMIKSMRKTNRRTTRKSRATSRPSPGGLERSISQKVEDRPGQVEGIVFVAANSEAGKYAKFIHDAKGSGWNRRGPGTRQKGTRSDDKFIERAISENESNIVAIIKSEIEKVVK